MPVFKGTLLVSFPSANAIRGRTRFTGISLRGLPPPKAADRYSHEGPTFNVPSCGCVKTRLVPGSD